jgi:hypothetical protein
MITANMIKLQCARLALESTAFKKFNNTIPELSIEIYEQLAQIVSHIYKTASKAFYRKNILIRL